MTTAYGYGKTEARPCPRCGEIPHGGDPWHRGMGALSRADNETEVCSACGHDEGMIAFRNRGRVQPVADWPVTRVYEMPEVERG